MRRPTPHLCSGFTFVDLMVTVTIMVVAAAIVLPSIGNADHYRLTAASRVLSSDMQLAQTMTIANPQKHIVVKINPGEYWLADASAPMVPIKRSQSNEDYKVIFGEGRGRGATGVTMTTSDLTGGILEFDAFGAVAELTANPRITLSLGGRNLYLDIIPTTGTIVESSP